MIGEHPIAVGIGVAVDAGEGGQGRRQQESGGQRLSEHAQEAGLGFGGGGRSAGLDVLTRCTVKSSASLRWITRSPLSTSTCRRWSPRSMLFSCKEVAGLGAA